MIQTLTESPSQAELIAYALEQGTMASVLLEEINERALEVIGDVVLDPAADPLSVDLTYQSELIQLLGL